MQHLTDSEKRLLIFGKPGKDQTSLIWAIRTKMNKTVTILTIVTSIYFMLGCGRSESNALKDPTYIPEDRTTFFKNYTQQLPNENNTIESLRMGMAHLGLPGQNHVVLWYRKDHLNKNSKATVAINDMLLPYGKQEDGGPYISEHLEHKEHPTGVFYIYGLQPDEPYNFTIKEISSNPLKLSARTAPLPASAKSRQVRFLALSCFQPYRYKPPYHMALETGTVLSALSTRCKAGRDGNGPSFILATGDQIYADPGAEVEGNKLPYLSGKRSEVIHSKEDDTSDFLDDLYSLHFALKPMNESLNAIPSVMMWDDHDIRDGWGSQGDEKSAKWQSFFGKSKSAFMAYQGARNPNFLDLNKDDWVSVSDGKGQLPENATNSKEPIATKRVKEMGQDVQMFNSTDMGFLFESGIASVFVADGRSVRDFFAKTNGVSSPISLGDRQMDKIKEWVSDLDKKHSQEPRVLVFSYPVPLAGSPAVSKQVLLKLHEKEITKIYADLDDDIRDRVSEKERSEILSTLISHVRKNKKHKLLLITGDVHYTGVQVLRDSCDNKILGYEIISSGLAQTEFKRGFLSSAFMNEVAKENKEIGFKVINHGVFVGPCFTEIVIDPPEKNSTDLGPVIRMMCYPGINPQNFSRAVSIDANASAKNAFKPECVDENSWSKWNIFYKTISLGFSNTITLSNLEPFLNKKLVYTNSELGENLNRLSKWIDAAAASPGTK